MAYDKFVDGLAYTKADFTVLGMWPPSTIGMYRGLFSYAELQRQIELSEHGDRTGYAGLPQDRGGLLRLCILALGNYRFPRAPDIPLRRTLQILLRNTETVPVAQQSDGMQGYTGSSG